MSKIQRESAQDLGMFAHVCIYSKVWICKRMQGGRIWVTSVPVTLGNGHVQHDVHWLQQFSPVSWPRFWILKYLEQCVPFRNTLLQLRHTLSLRALAILASAATFWHPTWESSGGKQPFYEAWQSFNGLRCHVLPTFPKVNGSKHCTTQLRAQRSSLELDWHA